MRRGRSALISCLFVAAASCGFPEFTFRATDEADSGHAESGPETGSSTTPSCPGPSTGDACTLVPRLPRAQKVDGFGDEFCDVPATSFDAKSAQYVEPSKPPAGVSSTARVHVAYSDAGLHVFVHVADPKVVVAPYTSVPLLTNGDSIEICAAGFGDVTGSFSHGVDVGAAHIVIAPPYGGFPPRALRYDSFEDGTPAALPSTDFAGRLVDDGYEIELHLRWADLTGTHGTPVAPQKIAFDVSINLSDDGKARVLQETLGFRPQTKPSDDCVHNGTTAEPYCDDRVWCTPSLQ